MGFIKDIIVRTKKFTATFYNLYTWGANFDGGVGDGTTTTRSSPVFITFNANAVSSGINFTHYIKNGGLYGMGSNDYGQLGDGSSISKSSPSQIGSQTYWYSVSSGGFHSLFISISGTDRKLWATGYNTNGALGTNDTISRSSPVQVGTEVNWGIARAAEYSCMAIRYEPNLNEGTLWAWGWNPYGELPTGNGNSLSSPVQIGASTAWSLLDISYSHGIGVESGNLYTWGQNYSGQLGDGTGTNRNSPVLIGSDGYISVSAGNAHSAFIKADGTLWTFGSGFGGQLGDGTEVNKSSPIQIGTGTNWHRVRCGYSCTHAMKTDGTLWAWGQNNQGQLGDGTTVNKSSPVQIGSLTTWIIAAELFDPDYFDNGFNIGIAVKDAP